MQMIAGSANANTCKKYKKVTLKKILYLHFYLII